MRQDAPTPEPTTLLLFAGAAMALLVVPGSSVIYIVTQRRVSAAIYAALGIGTALVGERR